MTEAAMIIKRECDRCCGRKYVITGFKCGVPIRAKCPTCDGLGYTKVTHLCGPKTKEK